MSEGTLPLSLENIHSFNSQSNLHVFKIGFDHLFCFLLQTKLPLKIPLPRKLFLKNIKRREHFCNFFFILVLRYCFCIHKWFLTNCLIQIV